MKAFVSLILSCAASVAIFARSPEKIVRYVYTEASELNLIGKILDDTPNPYHRVDTVKYKGFTKGENRQVRCPAGLAVLFKTDSPSISILAEADYAYKSNSTTRLASSGFDLYIRRSGIWTWAAAVAPSFSNPSAAMGLIGNMSPGEKECLLYLPIYEEMQSIKIGVEEGSYLIPMESPFRHRVAIFGSSFTHGISTSRAGMSYPMQFTRSTGIQMLSLGCSGNCKLQPYFADVLCDVKADAFVFDAFSNPSADMIKERLFPFIEKLQNAHPGKPLVFQRTIYRESRNFNTESDSLEMRKLHVADSMMRIAVRKYDHVYYICPNASESNHETSVDGIHPDNYGYTLWSRSIEKPLRRIFRKYGLK